MKKFLSILLIFMMIATPLSIVGAEEDMSFLPDLSQYDYRVWHNGTYISAPASPQRSGDGNLLVPLRAIFEADGASVEWEASTGGVTIKTGTEQDIYITLNTKTAKVSGQEFEVDLIVKDGTTLIDVAFFDNVTGMDTAFDPPTKTVIIATENAGTGDVILYDLGEGVLKGFNGVDIPYTINGSLALPDGTKSPVAIIMHGAHAIERSADNRYDIGFSYLMKKLAEEGYAVFAINVNMQFSFENGEPIGSDRFHKIVSDHIEAMVSANENGGNGFPVDLEGRLDLTNVTLIGHSRSGHEMFGITGLASEKGLEINGLVSVAAAYNYVTDGKYDDIPAAILIPQQDGDVRTLDGQKIYDEMDEDPDRDSYASLVYLYSANHNAFNEALLRQDNGFAANNPEDTIPPMNPDMQREVFAKYVLDFMNIVNDDGDLRKLPYDLNSDFYSARALYSLFGAERTRVFLAGADNNSVNVGAIGQMTIADVIGSYGNDLNTAGVMHFPGAPLELPLVQLSWNTVGSGASFSPSGASLDVSAYGVISLDIAQDSTSELNKNTDQSVTVRLTDASGNFEDVTLNPSALAWQPGKIITQNLWEDYYVSYYSNFTPLSSMRISLDAFSGVNLGEIASVDLLFEAASGCVTVKSISFTN